MLTTRRLTFVGKLWLLMFHLSTMVMLVVMVITITDVPSASAMRGGQDAATSLWLSRIGLVLDVWWKTSIILAILVWCNSTVLHPAEQASWDAADAARTGGGAPKR